MTTSEKFFLQMVFAVVNFLTSAKIPRIEATKVVNAVFLGHSKDAPKDYVLEPDDIEHLEKAKSK